MEAAQKRCRYERELSVIERAFEFANTAHKNVRRRSGEPYMLHPIAVAKIVVQDIGLGYKSIVAALLHDVVEDTDYTVDDIRTLFGDKIASLVEGLTKIKTVLDIERNEVYTDSDQAENMKHILLTLNDDVRVVLIKLADRLHNCRTIEYMPEHKRDKILAETMFIFVPLAHRLGLYEIKSEMENIWLKYKEPAAYKEIQKNVNKNVAETESQIDDFIKPIAESLEKAGVKFEIKKRVKTPYSIWYKMQTKKVSFEQVYDIFAIRIIFELDPEGKVSEREQCYRIFSLVTDLYRYNASRVRDWVKRPKSNGYEALHCTLMSSFGSWIEVQIRSRRMDDIAEKGIAAHWSYKRNGFAGEEDNEMDKWLTKVNEILDSNDVNAIELLDIIHNDLVSTDIVVFTPKGSQKTIMKGATALDFAYLIHSDIGYKAIAAKANMKLVPLSYVLKTGDQVEIITTETGVPHREWLQFLKTRKARNKVTEYFRDNYRQKYVEKGESLLSGYMGGSQVRSDKANMKLILDFAQISDVDEVFFRIGLGIIKLDDIAKALDNPLWKNKPEQTGTRYVFAPCCSPIPGDPIVGFMTPEGNIEVHKKSCETAGSLASKHGEWVVIPDWKDISRKKEYCVRISVKGLDRVGLLNEITHYLSLVLGINMRKIYLNTDGGIFEGYIELYVRDSSKLGEIIGNLSCMDGIQEVIRTDI